jgi:hypothetical protein
MIRSTRCCKATVLAMIAVVLAAPAAARAQPAAAGDPPDPAALALFRKGRELVAQGEWDAGCEKLEQSFSRAPTASTVLNLARCDEHRGKLASAWARVHQAVPLAERISDPVRRDELVRVARAEIAALEPRLPKLHVTIQSPASGVQLLDESGRALPSGDDIPLDPGPHRVRARAAGYRDGTFDVELAEGKTTALAVALALETATTPAGPEVARPAPVAEAQRPFPWLGAGLGVVGLVLGGVAVGFGVDSANASSDLKRRCGSDLVCNEDLTFDPSSLNDRKNTGLGLAIGFGGAALLALGAATWVLLRPSNAPARTTLLPSKSRPTFVLVF